MQGYDYNALLAQLNRLPAGVFARGVALLVDGTIPGQSLADLHDEIDKANIPQRITIAAERLTSVNWCLEHNQEADIMGTPMLVHLASGVATVCKLIASELTLWSAQTGRLVNEVNTSPALQALIAEAERSYKAKESHNAERTAKHGEADHRGDGDDRLDDVLGPGGV